MPPPRLILLYHTLPLYRKRNLTPRLPLEPLYEYSLTLKVSFISFRRGSGAYERPAVGAESKENKFSFARRRPAGSDPSRVGLARDTRNGGMARRAPRKDGKADF